MTVFTKVIQAGQVFELTDWRPWINCKQADRELIPMMALRRWVRERGGIMHGEQLTATVYSYDDETPKHKNGKPSECKSIEFTIGPRVEEAVA